MTVTKNNNWQVLCFYICALLFYPLVWSRLFTGRLIYWSELNLFTPGLIAILCCSLLLLDPKSIISFFLPRKAKLIALAFGFILLVSLIQLKICYDGQINYLWSSIYWIAVPLFCAVNRHKIEKYLPFFMILLGLATASQSIYEFINKYILFGITGNVNWNACLIALTFPFICLEVHKHFRKKHKTALTIDVFLIMIAAVLIYDCQSKATFLSLIIASCSLIVLRYWQKLSWKNWLRIGMFFAILGIVLLTIFRGHLFVFLKDDQRLFLWSGAFDLIKENLWFGCGPELFESSYAPYIPADYYFGRLVSTKHPHAHNHFLQFAATMGIPALIAWCSILFYVLGKNFRQAVGKGNWRLKLYLFAFILLFVHSMFDIIMLSWPLACIFLIILGILLGRTFDGLSQKKLKTTKITAFSYGIVGTILMLVLLNYLYFNLFSTMHYRNAKIMVKDKDIKNASVEIGKSIEYKMTPQNTLLAAKISLYDFKNPQACLKYLAMLDSLQFENYEHNNLLKAKALFVIGKAQESLLYFAKEQQNFPLSCVNLHYYRIALRKLGKKQQAEAIEQHLRNILKMKGFNEKMLPELLKDPDKDLKFRYYKGN